MFDQGDRSGLCEVPLYSGFFAIGQIKLLPHIVEINSIASIALNILVRAFTLLRGRCLSISFEISDGLVAFDSGAFFMVLTISSSVIFAQILSYMSSGIASLDWYSCSHLSHSVLSIGVFFVQC